MDGKPYTYNRHRSFESNYHHLEELLKKKQALWEVALFPEAHAIPFAVLAVMLFMIAIGLAGDAAEPDCKIYEQKRDSCDAHIVKNDTSPEKANTRKMIDDGLAFMKQEPRPLSFNCGEHKKAFKQCLDNASKEAGFNNAFSKGDQKILDGGEPPELKPKGDDIFGDNWTTGQ